MPPWLFAVQSAVLVVGTPLLVLYLQEQIKNIVRTESDRALADYRHGHDKALAEANAKHQKLLRDYGQYSAKRHDVYAQLYKRVRIANDRYASLLGFLSTPDFSKYDEEDIESYRKTYKLRARDVRKALELQSANDSIALGKHLDRLHWKVLVHRADRAFASAKNTEALYDLYLSDDVRLAMLAVRQAMAAVSVSFMHDDDDRDRKQMEKKHEMIARVGDLFRVMQKELDRRDVGDAAQGSSRDAT